MSKTTVYALGAIIILGIVGTGFYIFSDLDDEQTLVIYTYNSLLADPGYEFDRAFESYAGLPNGSVRVVLLDDSASIITTATAEKDNPIADVLIGIDNTGVFEARKNGILTPYQPKGSDLLLDGLVDGLASDYLLTPYDYGVISLWYLDSLRGEIDSSNFVLQDLLDPELAKQTIIEDPRLSSPGMGFLLETIAIYGDPAAGVTGVVSGDWEAFWEELSNNVRITPSWGEAIALLYNEGEDRSMMVSYTTSPAYGNCVYGNDSTSSLLSNEGAGHNWGWQQIEGLGLVNNAPHEDLGKEFIDWFISDEVQLQIYLNQWVYPAKTGIELPSCYSVVTPFDEITFLNDRIPIDVLEANLNDWLVRWELAIVG